MKKYFLLTLLACYVAIVPATAQNDDGDDEFGSEEAPRPTQSVGSGDYKKLAEALEEKNEDVMVDAARNILSKNPQDLKALNALAVFYIQTDRPGMAKILLDRALKVKADSPALHNNKGVIRLREGDMRGAIVEFREAMSAGRGHQRAGTNLGSIFLEYKDYSRALVPLKDGYSELKKDLRRGEAQAVQVANNYALALMGSGDPDEAADVFETILDTETRNNDVMLNYAILLVDVLKKPGKAKDVLGRLKFISEDPAMLRKVTELEKRSQSPEANTEKDE